MTPNEVLVRRLSTRASLSWTWDNAALSPREMRLLESWLTNYARSEYVWLSLTRTAPGVN